MELLNKVLVKFWIIKKAPNKVMISISKHGSSVKEYVIHGCCCLVVEINFL
jgi:hypothetical protein